MSNFTEYMDQFEAAFDQMRSKSYKEKYDRIIKSLQEIKIVKSRLFIIGMGGSAANAQHMANDFRKIAGIDAICLSDNIAELTARANDDGLETIYINALKVSNFNWKDGLFVLSVSGGNYEKNASPALMNAIRHAVFINANIMGIVGMPDSFTEKWGNTVIVTPKPDAYVTQVAEAMQAVIWHGIVSDPALLENKAKW